MSLCVTCGGYPVGEPNAMCSECAKVFADAMRKKAEE